MISPPVAALSVLTAMADAQFASSLDDIFGFSGLSYISDDDSCSSMDGDEDEDNGDDDDSASVKTVTPLRLAATRLAPAASGDTGELIPPTPIIILFHPAPTEYKPQTLLEIWAESDLWIKTGIERRYWNTECVPLSSAIDDSLTPNKKIGAFAPYEIPVR
jgi:hypothetical protein